MRQKIIDNIWEYKIEKCIGLGLQGYGYKLEIYKNNDCIYKQGGFGSLSIAQVYARNYFLMYEFNIERDLI